MTTPIHTLTNVRLVGFSVSASFDGATPRFSVIITPEQAEQVNALGPSRLAKPSPRDGSIWLTSRASNLPIHREAPNPWGEAFPYATIGDVAFGIYDAVAPQGAFRVVGFVSVRVTRYPTWDEVLAFAETRK